MPLAIALYNGYGPISIWSILPCPFYICTKFEIKILSLTEAIVFTRNGLHTYAHTYTQTFFIRYLGSACSKTDFSPKIFFLR